jgi:hypothetical protein
MLARLLETMRVQMGDRKKYDPIVDIAITEESVNIRLESNRESAVIIES